MLLPLHVVLKRGVVFLYPRFPALADPVLAGQTKPKYLVVLSASPMDDPVLYLLTTSRKPRHLTAALAPDFMHIPAGKYMFFPKETIINVAEAGDFSFDRDSLRELYDSGEIVYQGALDGEDVATLLGMIQKSMRVAGWVKRLLQP
ncbi:MAG TPA: hypothetical protein VM364_03680 [Vicinamibacterales bacterium]|nr:hypothetical protein [Vicinamibacterales bacterium]